MDFKDKTAAQSRIDEMKKQGVWVEGQVAVINSGPETGKVIALVVRHEVPQPEVKKWVEIKTTTQE